MYRLFVALLFTALSSSASAQASFGLVCSSQSEPVPRLLKISGSSVEFFGYGQETWQTLYSAAVDGDKISGRAISKSNFQNFFGISRINGSWQSQTDMNFNSIATSTTGVCVRKTVNEMDRVASDYLDQLNEKRAF